MRCAAGRNANRKLSWRVAMRRLKGGTSTKTWLEPEFSHFHRAHNVISPSQRAIVIFRHTNPFFSQFCLGFKSEDEPGFVGSGVRSRPLESPGRHRLKFTVRTPNLFPDALESTIPSKVASGEALGPWGPGAFGAGAIGLRIVKIEDQCIHEYHIS